MALRVGDRVQMSAHGKRRWPDAPGNPHDGVGILEDTHTHRAGTLPFWVRWDNGYKNEYAPEDLEPVPVRSEFVSFQMTLVDQVMRGVPEGIVKTTSNKEFLETLERLGVTQEYLGMWWPRRDKEFQYLQAKTSMRNLRF